MKLSKITLDVLGAEQNYTVSQNGFNKNISDGEDTLRLYRLQSYLSLSLNLLPAGYMWVTQGDLWLRTLWGVTTSRNVKSGKGVIVA